MLCVTWVVGHLFNDVHESAGTKEFGERRKRKLETQCGVRVVRCIFSIRVLSAERSRQYHDIEVVILDVTADCFQSANGPNMAGKETFPFS